MWYILVTAGILICAIMAIRAQRLLISAVWLALTSALVAIMIYMLGAPQIAVIELSVGAGLVTVLFVFAINIAGEEVIDVKSILPKWLVWSSLAVFLGLTIYLILHAVGFVSFPNSSGTASSILWDERYLDILLQVVLIFSGVLSVIGLLSNPKHESHKEDKA